ncbi:GNAT family N-acetyltransferase [Paenibacillus fonticola]|uniref:GNAT family N-acetyltransferase n=1 Tax=Paenibacillus fonticola TaxID=379896 RepID=UPI00035EFF7A|nr:GNAT family N-acetyltransferase [Paenibacillus fonticola]
MTLTIKKLSPEDAVPYDLLLLADPSKEIVDDYLLRGQCYIAARSGQMIVGVFVLLRTRPYTMEIINIAVREDFQGKGIGKKLMLQAIAKAKEQQVKTIEIGTGNSSLAQLALYQKCGFRIVGVDQDFFSHHYREEIFENGIRCRDMIRLRLEI